MQIKYSFRQSVQIQLKIFWCLFMTALTWAFLMSCLRLWTFLNIRADFQNVLAPELLQAFTMGFRFDLLVTGFILIPLVLILLAMTLYRFWPSWIQLFLKIYLIGFWLIISVVSILDLYFFTMYRRRMGWEQYSQFDFHHLEIFKLSYGSTYFYVYLIAGVFFTLAGVYTVQQNKLPALPPEPQTKLLPFLNNQVALILSLVLPFLVVLFMARGNFEAHHLAIEHCEISEQTIAREICINSSWNIDK